MQTFGFLADLLANDVLIVSILASTFAQFLKPFTYYLRTREFSWRHITETGGMPSSHSAMVWALATGVGLTQGFDSILFAASTVLALIVAYDASGIRQEAGKHASALNIIIAEVLEGNPLNENLYEEALGHTQREVLGGVVFGIVLMLTWKLGLQPLFL